MLTVACVRVGNRYGPEYVERLRNMVSRYLERPWMFAVLTDDPKSLVDSGAAVTVLDDGLPGFWSKMSLFSPAARYGSSTPTLYFDLDTVIVGSLEPLADVAEATTGMGICGNFTRAAGNHIYPCTYGSCVMTFAEGWGLDIWDAFYSVRGKVMKTCPHGDQQAIERLVHPADAMVLQDVLPEGYLCSYRDLTEEGPPDGAAVINFGGKCKPDNSPYAWVADAWL